MLRFKHTMNGARLRPHEQFSGKGISLCATDVVSRTTSTVERHRRCRRVPADAVDLPALKVVAEGSSLHLRSLLIQGKSLHEP